MPAIDDQRSKGKEMLKEVALRYASQHGLWPDRIEWVEQGGDEWWLKVATEQHSVKVVFSLDEIEAFTAAGRRRQVPRPRSAMPLRAWRCR